MSYENEAGRTVPQKGQNGAAFVMILDPATGQPVGPANSDELAAIEAGIGAPADAEAAAGNGSLVAIIKNIRTRLAGLLGVVPQMSAGGHISAQTTAAGTTYAEFGAQACKQFTLVNDTGTDLQVQQGGAGAALTIFAGDKFTFFGLTNTNQLGVKRKDSATTQVTVTGRWES